MFNYTWQAKQREATPQRGSKTTAELLSVGRANNNQPPPPLPKKHTESTDGRPRGGEGKGGREICFLMCMCIKAD